MCAYEWQEIYDEAEYWAKSSIGPKNLEKQKSTL